jgi:benzoate-CoA ligase family protein
MPFIPPSRFNIADYFLDARVAEGRGDRPALIGDGGRISYAEVQDAANRYANLLRDMGVEAEQRVIVALEDGPEFVYALFGILKLGAVVVMVNPHLKHEEVEYFLDYTRAVFAFVDSASREAFEHAAPAMQHLRALAVVDDAEFTGRITAESSEQENYPTHRDDAAIWLFSGGTTGRPKAVQQTHRAFANTTECYGKGVLGMSETDITLSVPKLYFGYATGTNLLFPFSVGGATALWPERCTADALFDRIDRFRPTVLVNVPTMINHLLSHEDAERRDFSSLRIATSAGEALPVELHRRWNEVFGVELLDGLGTAEMWHIFISNRPGEVRPGTLGKVVPGFEVRVCDDEVREVPDGEVGWLWVRGGSRAIGYWQQLEKTQEAFRGDWYVSGDMVSRDADGYFTYAGRGDDMLKVSGKWLSPKEVEGCLLEHPAVGEVAVVGVSDENGLTKPHAFVLLESSPENPAALAEELKVFVKERLDPYKYPRVVHFLDDLPRTHLGKVDRARLRREAG